MSHMHEGLVLVNFTCHTCMSYSLMIMEYMYHLCVYVCVR